ncbi:hypothetical protein ABVK25_004132 [Lepraria finkii]|uniref:Uncharacterized protein n=1 Tax=Lepraria finkii TaxID=1340010 RepID=A0ABR4BEU4_9LECA
MDAHHCKIDLQSPSDLTYLLNNINTAAQQKIDLAIPRSAAPEGEDAYRSRVEELVQEYILLTFTLAFPSLTLNGLDPSPNSSAQNPRPKPLRQMTMATTNHTIRDWLRNYEHSMRSLSRNLRVWRS